MTRTIVHFPFKNLNVNYAFVDLRSYCSSLDFRLTLILLITGFITLQMAQFKTILCALLIFTLVHDNEAATPFFLQAIASALGTMPFIAGPMTTGLVGAKLAVGSKLLYYLGFFGRRRSKPKPPARAKPKSNFGNAQFSQGMQYPQQFGSFGGGGFPQQFGGFNQPGFGGQNPYGYDPALMYQMLAAQGIDPTMAMQAMAMSDGGIRGQTVPSSPFPFPQGKNFQY